MKKALLSFIILIALLLILAPSAFADAENNEVSDYVLLAQNFANTDSDEGQIEQKNDENICEEPYEENPVLVQKLSAPAVSVSNNEETGYPMLMWSAVNGAEYYTVFRATSINGSYYEMFTTSNTHYTNTCAQPGNRYYYKVIAASSDEAWINSEFSEAVSGICTCAKPIVAVSNDEENGYPMLTWNNVNGADRYAIYRATSADGLYSLVFTTSNNHYTNTWSETANDYYYKVMAISNGNFNANSAFSEVVCQTCACAKPAVCAGNDAETGFPVLTWDAVCGADHYVVYRAMSVNGTYYDMFTTTNTRYSNTCAQAGYTYYYKIIAGSDINPNADSCFSEPVCRTCDCARPVIVEETESERYYPQLTWDAVNGADSYVIYRATDPNGTFYKMHTTTNTSYTNTSAEAGKTYFYKVAAACERSSYADSEFSELVCRTCRACTKPSVTAGNAAENGCPRLTWNAVSGADSYEVYRSSSADGTYSKMFTTSKTQYTNTWSELGNTYYYKVIAISGDESYADSIFSDIVCCNCVLAQPVVTCSNEKDTGHPNFAWDAVDGADYYEVYRATSPNGTFYKMFTTENTHYTNTYAQVGVDYYYKVIAVSEKGTEFNSASSDVLINGIYYKKIFLSPSAQTYNPYAYGNTNEAEQCRRIADALEIMLKRCGFAVINNQTDSMEGRASQSNEWGADLHIPIHTNAYNGKVSGTRIFTEDLSGEDYKCAEKVFGYLAPITPGKSERIYDDPELYEVKHTNALTVYIECEFHDVTSSAKWIIEHITDIASAICHGVCDYYNVEMR